MPIEQDYEALQAEATLTEAAKFQPLTSSQRQTFISLFHSIPDDTLRAEAAKLFLQEPNLPLGILSLDDEVSPLLTKFIETSLDEDYYPSKISKRRLEVESLKLFVNGEDFWKNCFEAAALTNLSLANRVAQAIIELGSSSLDDFSSAVSRSNAKFLVVADLGFKRAAVQGKLAGKTFTSDGEANPVFPAVQEAAEKFGGRATSFEDFLHRAQTLYPTTIDNTDSLAAFNLLARNRSFHRDNKSSPHDCIGLHQTMVLFETYGKLLRSPQYTQSLKGRLLREAA